MDSNPQNSLNRTKLLQKMSLWALLFYKSAPVCLQRRSIVVFQAVLLNAGLVTLWDFPVCPHKHDSVIFIFYMYFMIFQKKRVFFLSVRPKFRQSRLTDDWILMASYDILESIAIRKKLYEKPRNQFIQVGLCCSGGGFSPLCISMQTSTGQGT